MSTHTMTTDAEGRATFRCTEPADAPCHVWSDCLSEDGCESSEPDCTHASVQHDRCIYSVWWSTPEDAKSMHMDENYESDVTPKPNMVDVPIEIEWDECPLWSFAKVEAV